MAVGIHVARVGIFNVDTQGNILKKDDPSVTIKQMLTANTDHLVIEDAAISNTTGYPNVEEYLALEAADSYVVSYMDQSMIVTYNQA